MGDYPGFMPTDVVGIDLLLGAIECAARRGEVDTELIQKHADDAAALIASAPSLKEENERLRNALIHIVFATTGATPEDAPRVVSAGRIADIASAALGETDS